MTTAGKTEHCRGYDGERDRRNHQAAALRRRPHMAGARVGHGKEDAAEYGNKQRAQEEGGEERDDQNRKRQAGS